MNDYSIDNIIKQIKLLTNLKKYFHISNKEINGKISSIQATQLYLFAFYKFKSYILCW